MQEFNYFPSNWKQQEMKRNYSEQEELWNARMDNIWWTTKTVFGWVGFIIVFYIFIIL